MEPVSAVVDDVGFGWLLAAVVATAGALIGTNGPMIALGVTDPRKWGAVGWIADLIPHLGYRVVTAVVVCYLHPHHCAREAVRLRK